MDNSSSIILRSCLDNSTPIRSVEKALFVIGQSLVTSGGEDGDGRLAPDRRPGADAASDCRSSMGIITDLPRQRVKNNSGKTWPQHRFSVFQQCKRAGLACEHYLPKRRNSSGPVRTNLSRQCGCRFPPGDRRSNHLRLGGCVLFRSAQRNASRAKNF